MNEIAPETTPGLPTLALTPLATEVLPAAVQKLLASAVPAKMMAVKGIAPLRPQELLLAIYQLSFDADATVKAAAEAGAAALPDKVVVAPLGETLPASVLHFFAIRLPVARQEAMEKVLFNRATADETFVALAAKLPERDLEVIFQNEERLLRCPAIMQALYFNRHSRMSSLNRAIELCARNGVRIDGIPSFDEVVKSIRDDAAATAPDADKVFNTVLTVGEEHAPQAPAAAPAARAAPSPEEEKKSTVIDFGKLKLHEKIRLATLGNAYCRQHLIRDSNKVVAMAAIRSPLLTDNEVVMAASSRQVSEDVIRYIANQRDFMKMYQVKVNLVNNPKTPLAFSMRLLNLLNNEDIKTLSRSKNIPSALQTAAKKLAQTRKIGG